MWVASFEERPRLTPASLLPSSNTLTPYLDLGCLSARRLYYEMNNLYRRVSIFALYSHLFLSPSSLLPLFSFTISHLFNFLHLSCFHSTFLLPFSFPLFSPHICFISYKHIPCFFMLQLKGGQSRPPTSLHGQLVMREYFYVAANLNENFDRAKGNSMCMPVPWKSVDELSMERVTSVCLSALLN